MADPVVYIDDEESLCRIFLLAVGRAIDASVVTFVDPYEAVEYLDTHAVSVVLCDYRMPNMNGLEVLDKMKHGVPFFLLSGDLSVDETIADDSRLSGIIRKPASIPGLIDLVRSFIQPAPAR